MQASPFTPWAPLSRLPDLRHGFREPPAATLARSSSAARAIIRDELATTRHCAQVDACWPCLLRYQARLVGWLRPCTPSAGASLAASRPAYCAAWLPAALARPPRLLCCSVRLACACCAARGSPARPARARDQPAAPLLGTPRCLARLAAWHGPGASHTHTRHQIHAAGQPGSSDPGDQPHTPRRHAARRTGHDRSDT